MRVNMIVSAVAIALSFVAGNVTGAFAAEMNDGLKAKVEAICANKSIHLSDKATAVCTSKQYPSVTKAGLFRNAGVGAEFNTLMRQGS